MMKISSAIMFALALLLGVAVGYMFNPSVDEVVSVADKRVGKSVALRDDGDSATIATLRSRISTLEKELAAAKSSAAERAVAGEDQTDARKAEPRDRGHEPRENFRTRLERLKSEDPKQYEELINRISQHRQRRQDQMMKKLDYFSSINASALPASARKTHEELMDQIEQMELLEEQMNEDMAGDGSTEEQRRERFEKMRQLSGKIRDLNRQERRNLISVTVGELGFDDNVTKEVTTTIQEIVDQTENGFGHGGNPPPPPR